MPRKKRKDVDLSEFLSPDIRKKLAEDPKTQSVLPHRHIWCTQCFASGQRHDKRTRTIPLTAKAEETLLDLGANPPIQTTMYSEYIKCEHCAGTGHHYVYDREHSRTLTMFWTEIECHCGRTYEAPAYINSLLVRTDFYSPIIRAGKLHGWRYSHTKHLPAEDIAYYDKLPYRIERVKQHVRHCRKCVHEHVTICLPYLTDEDFEERMKCQKS